MKRHTVQTITTVDEAKLLPIGTVARSSTVAAVKLAADAWGVVLATTTPANDILHNDEVLGWDALILTEVEDQNELTGADAPAQQRDIPWVWRRTSAPKPKTATI